MRLVRWILALALVAGAAGWWVTRPAALPDSYADLAPGDAEAGRVVFAAAGCASCHVAPEAEPGDTPVLAGGKRFDTRFGTFVAPNISPSSQGIGDWTDAELIHAIRAGVGRDGTHLYPSFPYTSYARSDPQDIADLVAHMRTLPPDPTESQPHDLGFPFNIRRSLGGWKLLYLSDDWVLAEAATPEIARGRTLVEALGHCAECHTPRNALGAPDLTAWMAGAENPGGDGRIPGIDPGTLDWSESQIANYLDSGFTPEFDTAGGDMVDVIANTARLSDQDRAAIAAYLKAIPAIE
ncbi:MAG: diheme cytochrome c [Rhodobacteraceae bacterium HLUCCA08]|nr:MAG: diheme cytochrome c [Rhodobacteraceae bacterium HLUCCA08]